MLTINFQYSIKPLGFFDSSLFAQFESVDVYSAKIFVSKQMKKSAIARYYTHRILVSDSLQYSWTKFNYEITNEISDFVIWISWKIQYIYSVSRSLLCSVSESHLSLS